MLRAERAQRPAAPRRGCSPGGLLVRSSSWLLADVTFLSITSKMKFNLGPTNQQYPTSLPNNVCHRIIKRNLVCLCFARPMDWEKLTLRFIANNILIYAKHVARLQHSRDPIITNI